MSKCTELPLSTDKDESRIYDADGDLVAVTFENPDVTRFIVKACNNHYKILESLKELAYNYPSQNLGLSIEKALNLIEELSDE